MFNAFSRIVLTEDTIFMSPILFLLLETEPPFYVVIQGKPNSIHLQGEGSTFKTRVLVWPQGPNLRTPV